MYHQFGHPAHVLTIENRSTIAPKSDEMVVRTILRPINPSDLIPITGAYAHRTSLPGIPGYEGIGIVEEVGNPILKSWLGKRVLPLRGEGTWQDYVTAPARWVVPVPDSIADWTAAQLYINPVTAWVLCTEWLKLKEGDTLLVNAGGSAISRVFAQLSNIVGFRYIAVVRNDVYTRELKHIGASHVIHSSSSRLVEAVLELTNGRGADFAIDCVGGQAGKNLAYAVRPFGTLTALGLLSGEPVDWWDVTKQKDLSVNLFHLRHWNRGVSEKTWHETFETLMTFIGQGLLQLMTPRETYDLTNVHTAIKNLNKQQANNGKHFLASDH